MSLTASVPLWGMSRLTQTTLTLGNMVVESRLGLMRVGLGDGGIRGGSIKGYWLLLFEETNLCSSME